MKKKIINKKIKTINKGKEYFINVKNNEEKEKHANN